MNEIEIALRDAVYTADAKSLAALELRLYALVEDIRSRTGSWPSEQQFAAMGHPPLCPSAYLGRACQRMTCRVPWYESRLAELADLERGDVEGRWIIPIGAPLNRLVRWFSVRKFLTLRVARCGGRAATPPSPGYSDDQFTTRALQGIRYVEQVAGMLRQHDVNVEVTEYQFREREEDIALFSQHETDLMLVNSRVGIEVKSRTIDWRLPTFTSNMDTLFVDTLTGYLSKLNIPLAYVVISQVSDAVAVIPAFTCLEWGRQWRADSTRIKKDGKPLYDWFLDLKLERLYEFSWLASVCGRLEEAAESERSEVLEEAGYPLDLAQAILRGSPHLA